MNKIVERAEGERVMLIDGIAMSMDDCPVRDVLDSVGGKWTSSRASTSRYLCTSSSAWCAEDKISFLISAS